MKRIKNPGRIAGLFYLSIIIFGIYAEMGVRRQIIVVNDLSQTAKNILNHSTLFRIGIASDLLMILSFLGMGITLYMIYRPFHRTGSLVMLSLNVVGTIMMAMNLIFQYAGLYVLTANLPGFTIQQTEALSGLFMNLYGMGYELGAIGFGIYLTPLGYLVLKSHTMPKIIGYFLILSGISYFIRLIALIIIPENMEVVSLIEGIITSLGEFSFAFWLLAFGVKQQKLVATDS